MSKKSGGQTQTTSIDPATQAYQQQVRNASAAAGAAGPGSVLTGSAGYGTAAQGAGATGLAALSGNPGAVSSLMNPYLQGVIGANNTAWQKINAQTQNQISDQATQANAFGGSRQGVASGVAQANNNAAQAQQNAGLLSSGYDTAMQQASQLANFGQQGANANANLGFGGVGNNALWNARMLQQGMVGPYGQTTTTTGKQGSSFLGSALGGAEAGSALGPWGALGGGIIGGLSSLF